MFYDYCCALGGITMDWATLVRNHLPYDHTLQWNATRLPLASVHIMFFTLNVSLSGESIHADEWDVIVSRAWLAMQSLSPEWPRTHPHRPASGSLSLSSQASC
jgi:hypothetical protein